MFRCVIFDIDGTLLDTEKAIIKSLQRIMKEESGKSYGYEELTFALGIPGNVTLEKLEIKNIETVWKRWGQYLREEKGDVRIFPGINETLAALKERGIKAGVVTSKNRDEVNKDFLPFGLTEHMQYLVCADDTKRHKPDPEPILKFLEISEAKAAEAIYVGDTMYDKHCAHGAGIKFALALWGARNPEETGGDYPLAAPMDILKLP